MSDLVVVVGERGRLRDYVRYAVREGRDAAQETTVTARFVVPVGRGGDTLPRPTAATLAERVEAIVGRESLGRLTVETVLHPTPGTDPEARLEALVGALPETPTRLLLSPAFEEFTPAAVSEALATRERADSVTVERAPVERRVLRPPLAFERSPGRLAATFGVSFAFYLALGDPTDPFDLATGVLAAAVVAALLSRVVLESTPTPASLGRVARAVLFLPYLLYAIVRANLAMAVVVLHPRLPIDPSVVRVPAPEGRVARALLANSITLTPGTLTVDVVDDELVVHALTAETRAELEAGGLARAVAFVTGEPAPTPTVPVGGETG
ncbi:Na+/H+ antiporter subunit E [Salinirubellus salinus]|uniref:Na+/H+ antiporter subunit E n=1 Tax=Salinirubellus salinus TaxID=1364945 RepID=A0A9E7R3S3_9EURY|nr:Na+/H+ antiporter subunit E [Salinirubellus salinus]UWM54986.1 Na+/H+ antiporter subunit E [Salinirubellus salinus]